MIRGIDVSHHQGEIDWGQVRRETDIQFAVAKATEGIRFEDVWFERNLIGAQNQGMIAGAYHFLRSDSDVEQQVNLFLNAVGRTEGILCMLDVEPSGASAPKASHAFKFAHFFRQRTNGHPLLIYTGRWYWAGSMGNPDGSSLGPLWHSAYTQDPGPLYGGWRRFSFWQYTSSGRVAGISTRVDLNWFYGGINELKALTIADAPLISTETEIPEMILARNQETGSVLIYSGGASILIDNDQDFHDHARAGIPVVDCRPGMFKRYENCRIDRPAPSQ